MWCLQLLLITRFYNAVFPTARMSYVAPCISHSQEYGSKRERRRPPTRAAAKASAASMSKAMKLEGRINTGSEASFGGGGGGGVRRTGSGAALLLAAMVLVGIC